MQHTLSCLAPTWGRAICSVITRRPSRGATAFEYLALVAAALLLVVTCVAIYGRSVRDASHCLSDGVQATRKGATCAHAGQVPRSLGNAAAPLPGHEPPKTVPELICDHMGCYPSACFVAGTLVATPAGHVPIERLSKDDLVLAVDAENPAKAPVPRRVLGTKRTEDRDVVLLTLIRGDAVVDVLRVTGDHPFLQMTEEGPSWRGAQWLPVGAEVATAGGRARVVSVVATERRETVYNLAIAELHTYLVGALGAVVHNSYEEAPPDWAEKQGFVDPQKPDPKVLSGLERGWLDAGKPVPLPRPPAGATPSHVRWLANLKTQADAAHKDLVKARELESKLRMTPGLAQKGQHEASERALSAAAATYFHHVASYVKAVKSLERGEEIVPPTSREQLTPAWQMALRPPEMATIGRPGHNAPTSRESQKFTIVMDQLKSDGDLLRALLGPTADEGSREVARSIMLAGYEPAPLPMLVKPETVGYSSRPYVPAMHAAGDNLRQAYAREVLERGTAAEKARALELVTETPFEPTVAHTIYARRFQEELRHAYEGKDSGMKQLARLMQARALANDPKWANQVHLPLVEQEIDRLLREDLGVRARLGELHAETMAEVKQTREYKRQLEMLGSEKFLLRLQLERPDRAKLLLEAEIAKVAAVDPVKAKAILDAIVGRQVMHDFHALDVDKRARALEQAADARLAQLAAKDPSIGKVKNIKAGSDVWKRIAKVLKESGKRTPDLTSAAADIEAAKEVKRVVDAAANAGEITPSQQSLLHKALGFTRDADSAGAVSAVAATAGLFVLATELSNGEVPLDIGDSKFWTAVAASSKAAAGIPESYAKLGAWTLASKFAEPEWTKTGWFGKTFLVVKWGSPIGDAITTLVDGRRALDSIGKGHVGDAMFDLALAGTGLALTIANVATAAGVGGTLGPITMMIATIGYIGIQTLRWSLSDSEEVALLKAAGVYRDLAAAAAAERDHANWQLQQRHAALYENSTTSRRNFPSPHRELDLLTPRDPFGQNRLSALEAATLRREGPDFYRKHAPPGSCGKCH